MHFNRRFERRVTIRGNERSRVGYFERWDHQRCGCSRRRHEIGRRVRLLLLVVAAHRIVSWPLLSTERCLGNVEVLSVGVYSFFSRKIDSSSDVNEQKRKDKASSFPFRRDACASSSDDVCSREIKREFFDKFPLKRKEGRFCCLERCEGKGLTFYTYILYIISKNFTTTQVFILGCNLRARRGVAERLSVFPIRQ